MVNKPVSPETTVCSYLSLGMYVVNVGFLQTHDQHDSCAEARVLMLFKSITSTRVLKYNTSEEQLGLAGCWSFFKYS